MMISDSGLLFLCHPVLTYLLTYCQYLSVINR